MITKADLDTLRAARGLLEQHGFDPDYLADQIQAAEQANRDEITPHDRLAIAVDTLADALDPQRLGPNHLDAPDLREAAEASLEAWAIYERSLKRPGPAASGRNLG